MLDGFVLTRPPFWKQSALLGRVGLWSSDFREENEGTVSILKSDLESVGRKRVRVFKSKGEKCTRRNKSSSHGHSAKFYSLRSTTGGCTQLGNRPGLPVAGWLPAAVRVVAVLAGVA